MTAHKLGVSILMMFAVASPSYSKPMTTIPTKMLLIDTDVGSDDAFAILMALEAEKLDNGPKIIGITCVNGNAGTDQVALNVLKTLKVAGRLDIPVYKGATHPLLVTNTRDNFFGQDGFGDFYYPDPPSQCLVQEKNAVIAMIEMVKAHPGEITLLALGPLTNVALAIRLHPSFLDDLQQLIVLGGSAEGLGNVRPGIEFNFFIDPAANYVVFNSSTTKPTTLVPWETTVRSRLTRNFRTSLSKSNNEKVWLIDSAEGVFLRSKLEYWNPSDAVATVVALTSGSIVTESEYYYLEAVYSGPQAAGVILVDYTNVSGNAANTNLIRNINQKSFEELILRYITS